MDGLHVGSGPLSRSCHAAPGIWRIARPLTLTSRRGRPHNCVLRLAVSFKRAATLRILQAVALQSPARSVAAHVDPRLATNRFRSCNAEGGASRRPVPGRGPLGLIGAAETSADAAVPAQFSVTCD